MAVIKSLVLTLRCHDYSETSQVVSLLARDVGRLRCLAKGSKRGQNPFGGPLDRWTLGEAVFSLRDPNRLATLMELYEFERFGGLRRKMPAFYGACVATELLGSLIADLDPQPELFDLAADAFRRLDEWESAAARAVTFAFAWRLLRLLGYGPDMGRCVQCGATLDGASPVDFSQAAGGPVCGACVVPGRRIRLSAKASQAITFLALADWPQVRRVRLSDATAGHLRAALAMRVEELSGKRVASLTYV